MLGYPCLFRMNFPDGKVILAVTYVDDYTFAVSEDAGHGYSMSMLRSRFEIDEYEGRPIEFLLGMAIEQNLKGTVRMDNDVLKSAFDPDLLPSELEIAVAAARYAERQFARVMNAQSGANINFWLAAEPTEGNKPFQKCAHSLNDRRK